MYRPKGWNNTYAVEYNAPPNGISYYQWMDRRDYYERGADAILVALIKKGVHGTFGDGEECETLGDVLAQGRVGTLIFIPDGTEDT